MHRKTTMAVLAVAVALLGVVASVQTGGGVDEVDAANAGTVEELKEAFTKGGDYVLSSDITISEALTLGQNVTLVLDLNGQTLTTTDTITISGSLTVNDSSGNGSITSNVASKHLLYVNSDATLIINAGTISLNSNSAKFHTIMTYGTTDINGGNIVRSGVTETASTYSVRAQDGLLSIDGATITSSDSGVAVRSLDTGSTHNDPKATISDTTITAGQYGIAVFGNGSFTDNESVTLTVDNSAITADVCIGTNASNGAHAGFTITINSGTFDGVYGIYAPGHGIYNINGGHLIGEIAGIQIAAGILNIRDGAVIETEGTNADGYNSLVATSGSSAGSGPGDICGAVVIGKASGGYWGNIEVNVEGGRLVAPEGGDALVVCDNATGLDTLADYSTSVETTGGEIDGNVVLTTASNEQYNNPTQKKENKVAFDLDGANVDGNIVKSDGFTGSTAVTSGSVSGNVSDDVTKPASSGTVRFDSTGQSYTYYGSFKMPGAPEPREGDTFLGYSLIAGSTSDLYDPYQVVTTSGNVTVYEVWESDIPSYNPGYDDDEDLPPFIPTQPAEDDDTVTIVACAAAAAVAAILAVFLVIDRK